MINKKSITFEFSPKKKKVSLSPSGYIISNPTAFTNTDEFLAVVEKFAKWELSSKNKNRKNTVKPHSNQNKSSKRSSKKS